ncbi:DNA adenine methylase [Sphingobacterium cavernae]|uniref:DNA adenine methylase n=1 Tax=Sphingobacterium cavernae TaxID=2592657 RepID=UPI001230180F|nr:DNA adenine methylase [Sphingobacterium cavernae]
MKNYTQAPLPFQGQKRRFIRDLKDILKDYPEDAIYIDLFGGSGLLAHTVRQIKPNSRVVYNDFDNYYKRLLHINQTNALISKIRKLVDALPKNKKIPEDIKSKILQFIQEEDHKGYVDYITLSSSLLFSANYAINYNDFAKATFYNVVKQNDYNADDYLLNVDRVQLDYKKLYDIYKNNINVVWLIDPPYLSTDSSSYNSNGYWKLHDYLDVLKVLEKHPYVYFTSNKSSIVELCEWIATKVPDANPFDGAYLKTVNVQMNYNSTYTDMMYYKYSSRT